ncbi:hypothetical protein [uncultured Sulfitobacter sp.]|uniref:hypothetical protein n=1 Tax=uncultured Sulfitobacter sp. TaxID=191468 RepID=UPI002632F28E|nr:hypothetical protein [uncultured Sulfitobacter sp.]
MIHAAVLGLVLVVASVGAAAAQSYSKAARYLMAQEIKAACPLGGRFTSKGAIERDLNGDGRKDLLLSHGELRCKGSRTLSKYCGMQVCTVKIFVRQGQLLKLSSDFLGGGVTLGPTNVPVISGYAHGGAPWAIRWNGRNFR